MQAHTSPRLPEPERRELVEEYLGLAKSIASRLARTARVDIHASELQSFACIGLIQASHGYRPTIGKSFAGYAYPRVRGAVLDGLASLLPVPRGCYRSRRGEFVHISDEREYESICHEPADAAARTHRLELARALQVAVAALPDRERALLYWHFVEDLSVAEAARKIDRSRSWGCRARARALSTLREELAHLRDEW